MVWNAHLVAPGLSFYPFLVESFLLRPDPGTHAGVLRDTTSYFVWCCAPLVLATGAVKGVATRRRERFGWRHRAGLGGACFLVFAVYVWTQRSSASLPATLAACSAADLVASGAVPDLHRRACTALLERRGGRVVACATTRTGDCLEHSLELEAGA